MNGAASGPEAADRVPVRATSAHAGAMWQAFQGWPEGESLHGVATLASQITQCPMAAVSLKDSQNPWFNARVGLDDAAPSRSAAFCAHALQGGELFEVEDARLDSRFANNPVVQGEAAIRYYCGIPLISAAGEPLGVLCVMDHWPRRLEPAQRKALALLAGSLTALAQQRIQLRCLEDEIVRRRHAEQQALHLASRDALTGLVNRAALMDRLDHAMKSAARNGAQVAFLFMDLDGFKMVNDSLGHAVGDDILIHTAERLRLNLRESDTVARLGSDEFGVVLELADEDHIPAHMALKLLQAMAAPFLVGNMQLSVQGCIGIACYPEHADTPETLVQAADLALCHAKSRGRGRHAVFIKEMNRQAVERVTLEQDLREALDGDEFLLQYQPQVALNGTGLSGLEALVRWRHPRLGLTAPARFIPLAEESGLIAPLGLRVLDLALAQVRSWLDLGFSPPRVAVNVSPLQLRHGFDAQVRERLKRHGVEARRLEIEITESALSSDDAEIVEVIEALHRMGVSIAVDDFGVGYSSFALLRRLPLSTLKIDRSFVQDVATSRRDAAIVQAIIQMGRGMGMRLLAEGVEAEEQQAALRALACDDQQGHLISRPLDPDGCIVWMGRA